MEKVLCRIHSSPCMLKTGVKDGPNKGKSFYICSERRGTPCDFTEVASIPPSHCLNHEDSVVELQTLVHIQQQHRYRLFYRCVEGKKAGHRWCGNLPWSEPEKECRGLLADRALQPPSLAPVRNPFKAPSRTDAASDWTKHHHREAESNGTERKTEKEKHHEKQSDHRQGSEKERDDRRGLEGRRMEEEQGESWKDKQLPAGMKIKKRVSDEEEKSAEMPLQEKKVEEMKDKNASSIAHREGGEAGKPRPSNTSTLHTERSPADSTSRHGDSTPTDVLRETDGHAGKQHSSGGKKSGSSEPRSTSSGDTHPARDAGNSTTPPCDKPAQPHSIQTERGKPGAERAEQSCVPPQSQDAPRDKPRPPSGEGSDDDDDDDDDVQLVSVQPGTQRISPSPAVVQKTLTSFAGFQSASLVKGQQEDPRVLHSQLTTQLKQKKATLSVVNVSALPDKGQRLKNQVRELEDALLSLSLTTASEPEGEVRPKSSATQANSFSRQGGTVFLPAGPAPPNQGPGSSLGPPLSQGHAQTHGGNLQNQAFYGGRMTGDRLLAVKNATCEAIDHLHKSLESCPGPDSAATDPRGIKVPLLAHQRGALAWLLWRETQKPCGGILADDMGLGKTLTMIALILAQKAQKREQEEKDRHSKQECWLSRNEPRLVESQGTLIICPASLLHHWKKEMERYVTGGRLAVYLYHGAGRQRSAQLLAEHDVVVTTYSLVSKEIPVQKEDADKPNTDVDAVSSDQAPLLRVSWARLVLDEAHNIKNPKVQTSLAVCRLRARARWAVTGTPVQNNLLDMYSLLRFLRCSPFDEFKLWKNQVDNGSKRGGERLNILTRALLLRRTKDQQDAAGQPLVCLPERTCQLHRLRLSEEEQRVYDVVFAQSRSTLQKYLKRHEGGRDVTKGSGSNPFDKVAQEFGVSQSQSEPACSQQPQQASTIHILSLLLRLRQCCCHLSLLKKTLDQAELQGDGVTLSLDEQLSALCLSESSGPDPKATVSLNGTRFPTQLFEDTHQSTKIYAILTELKEIRQMSGDQKSVVVSQWTSMLQIVSVHLKAMGLRYTVIDGSVNPKRRMDLVEEFNTNPKGPQVMLVSLCAGGVGINLIGGNHLFLMDMHWNPALEDQACDRIYRVGQRRDVTIHRFVCEGTVEDKISTLQERKKELAQKVLSGTGASFTKLSLADLRVIFGV